MCCSLLIISRVTEHPDLRLVAEGHEVADKLVAFREHSLCLWVFVWELDTVLVVITRKNLDLALDVCATNRFFRLFCWLAANIGLKFKAQLWAWNTKIYPLTFKEDNQLLKEVKMVASHEKLCVVVDEAITIFINLELSPGFFAVLRFKIILRSHSTSSVWLAWGFGLITLLALLFTLVMCLLIDEILTIRKVSLDLCSAGTWTSHPWVSQNFLESGSVWGIEGHHPFKQVLELSSVDVIALLCFSMSLPESCRLSGSYKSIVRVIGVSTRKRRSLSDNDEKNDSGGKKVNAGTLIWSA